MDDINTLPLGSSRHTSRSSPVVVATSHNNNNNNNVNSTNNTHAAPVLSSLIHSQSLSSAETPTAATPVSIVTSTSSLSNLFDGFTSRVTGDLHRGVGPSSSAADLASSEPASGGVTSGSLVSLTSIGSLGTTANAFYSSIGLAFNSLTSPITAAAAAAHATGAEAAAVVVAAASAISNHLSSPTNGTPPNLDDEIDDDDDDDEEEEEDDEDEEDDCEDYEDDKEANANSHVPASSSRKSWTEIKAAVNDMRKQLSNMSSLVPTNIQFRNLSDGRVRCYFLSTPPNAWETTLLYTDINATKTGANSTTNCNNINTSPSNTTKTTQSASSSSSGMSVTATTTTAAATIKNNNNFTSESSKLSQPTKSSSSNNINSNARAKTRERNMMMVSVDDHDNLARSSQPMSLASPPMQQQQHFAFNYNHHHHQQQHQSINQHQHLNQLQHVEPMTKRLHWNTVLQQPLSNVVSGVVGGVGGSNIWSREYQLLQERKRLSTWGITSYELHRLSGKIVFPCFSDLYQCLDTGFNSIPLFPTQLRTCPQWAALDPQICPQNSDLIAYISGFDIWVTHTLSGHEERLTFAHDGRRPFADDPLSAGAPSYVMQEEFGRYQGYWWQPKSNDGIYRIVYEEVDESDVCLYTFPSSQAMPGEMDEYRFPRTGTHNAKSKLKIVQFTLSESLRISDVCVKDLPYSLTSVLPWLEYIVRVGWTPDSQYVWIQAMNRKQQRLDVVLIPLDNFCESYSSSTSSPSASSASASGGEHCWRISYCRSMTPLQVIYSQVSDSWINVHDLLYFLEITDDTVTFLWGSEETGYRHLYLITSSLVVLSVNGCRESNHVDKTTTTTATTTSTTTNTTNSSHGSNKQAKQHFLSNASSNVIKMETNNSCDYFENGALSPRIINKVALTSGEWEVLGRNLWVDKNQLLVYFLGLRDTPLEKHLYVVSLQRPEHIRLLTEPGYSYLVEFDESCQLMMQVYCNIERLPSCKVVRVEQQMCQNGGVNAIQLSLEGFLHEGGKPDPQYCPQIFRPQLPSGEVVYAMVFKPHNFQVGVKYPAVLNVYGGPEVQTVNNTFKGKHQLRMHMLAAQGYCVICIDSRGSRHRGLKFESYLRCRMGQVELTDQVDALRILAEQLSYIDMNRVAIHGWSYGGYLSLMGLVQYPDMFKIAIAGAPVTNWEYYDTGYTERYMDLPQNNKQGYTAGSVLNYIHAFPEEENRLLLIHGLIDENVHFYHTSQLIAALNKANKPYDLHIFPHERHSLRNIESNKNYETKLLSFLQNL